MSAPLRGPPKVSTSSATTGQSTSSTSNAPSGTTATPITPPGPSHPVPQFEIQPDNTRNVDDDDWEDEIVIERSPRGRRPVHSILHNRGPNQGSRNHSADSGAHDSIHSRNSRPRNVTFRDSNDNNGSEGRGSSRNSNRSIKDYLTRHLNMNPSSPPLPATASNTDQAGNNGAPHFQPRSLAPDDILPEEAFEEIGLSRPESPEKYAFGFSFPQPVKSGGGTGQQAPTAVSPTNAPPFAATDANPTTTSSVTPTQPRGFQIVTVPPTVSNPLSPLASPTAEPNLPARSNPIGAGKENPTGKKVTMEQNSANGTAKPQYPPPIIPPVSNDTFLTADKNLTSDNARRRAQYETERRRQHASEPGPSRQAELGAPKRQRENEIGPIRSPRHAHGPRRQSNNRHGRGPRRRADPLYRPTDPYAFPTGQQKSPIPPLLRAVKWAVMWLEDKAGGGDDEDEESGESKASSLSKGKGKQEKPTGDAIPMTETISRPTEKEELPTTLPDSVKRRHAEAEAVRLAEEQRRLELERTKDRLRRESIEVDQDYKEMQRRLERERRELEHGLPTVPRTSPTQITRPLPTDGAESAHTEPAGLPRPPVHTGALSPPTASPDLRPASDPGTPPKRRSPFKLPINLPFARAIPATVIEREKKMELTLRQWIRFATIQVYRHVMLRLPSLYFNRVGRVFVEAEISAKEVELLVNRSATAGPDSLEARVLDRRSELRGFGGFDVVDHESEPLLGGHHDSNSLSPSPNTSYKVLGDYDDYHRDIEAGSVFRGSGAEAAHTQIDPSLAESLKRVERFRLEWESFVDGLIKEWKTLNVVSALLLSALLTVFQIQDASYVPVTRTAALLSLVSAFLSLLFGGVYIIRFSTMRTMRKAARWVEETRKEKQRIFWNIWILLSMPFTWLAYSLIFFCISLMGFIWTSGTGIHADPPSPPIPDKAAIILGPRIAITIIFSIGIIYFLLVLNTFRSWSGTTVGQTDTTGDMGRPSGETDLVGLTPDQTPHLMGNTALPAVGANNTMGFSTGNERDGLSALASANQPSETRQQRTAEMTKSLTRQTTGSAESALQLDLTPPGHKLDGSQLTETPPSMVPLVLPLDTGSEKPITMITEPTPLSATNPLMGALNSLAQPPPSAEARPFHRHEQSDDLDRPLPPMSPTLAPIQEVTEFGSLPRSGGGFRKL